MSFKEQISDQGMGIVASHLAACQGLKSLTLRFQGSSQTGDQNLYFLLSGIRGLLLLEDLQIQFWQKEPFGEKAATEFLEGLIVLNKMPKLLFDGSMDWRQKKVPSFPIEEIFTI